MCVRADLFPFEDPVVVLLVPGDTLRAALENGLSKLPATDGRFLQVSKGLEVRYDVKRSPGSRLLSLRFNGRDVESKDSFKVGCGDRCRECSTLLTQVAVPISMASGMEDCPLVQCERLIDRNSGLLPSTLLRNHFAKLHAVRRMRLASSISPAAERALARMLRRASDADLELPSFSLTTEGRVVCVNGGQ